MCCTKIGLQRNSLWGCGGGGGARGHRIWTQQNEMLSSSWECWPPKLTNNLRTEIVLGNTVQNQKKKTMYWLWMNKKERKKKKNGVWNSPFKVEKQLDNFSVLILIYNVCCSCLKLAIHVFAVLPRLASNSAWVKNVMAQTRACLR